MQVNTVPARFHALEVTKMVDGKAINCASVASVFIGSLKVMTTAADGETPEALLAGMVEIIVGSPWSWQKHPKEIAEIKMFKEKRLVFI